MRSAPPVPLLVTPSDFIETIYAAALAPDGWDEAVSALAVNLGSSFGAIILHEEASTEALSTFNLDRGLLARDPFFALLLDKANGQRGKDFGEDRSQAGLTAAISVPGEDGTRRSPAIGQWLHVFGAIETPGSLLQVGIGRAPGGAAFRPAEIAAFRDAARHIVRSAAVTLRLRVLEARKRVWEKAVDRMVFGLFVLGAEGELIEANAAGFELLHKARFLETRSGRLMPSEPRKAKDFSALVTRIASNAAGAERGALVVADGKTGVDGLFVGMVRLFRGQPEEARSRRGPVPAIAVYTSEIDRDYAQVEDLIRQAFQLTRMEARTATAILKGGGIDEVARTLGVGRETVRAHVRSVFAKTGTRRQSQLVHRMLGAAVSLMG